MDDGTIKQKVLIDPQEDFNAAASSWAEKFSPKIKDYLKDFNYKSLKEEMPLKKMRHDEPIYNHEKIWINKIAIPPLDMSGSMKNLIDHELPHVYKAKDLEAFDKEIFSKGKIIVFDEIEKDGGSMTELLARISGFSEGFRTSQERGEELAESFQQGAAAPVRVRRALSLRTRAGCTA